MLSVVRISVSAIVSPPIWYNTLPTTVPFSTGAVRNSGQLDDRFDLLFAAFANQNLACAAYKRHLRLDAALDNKLRQSRFAGLIHRKVGKAEIE